jgi:transcriptional regulator with XRE-family HTH domain
MTTVIGAIACIDPAAVVRFRMTLPYMRIDAGRLFRPARRRTSGTPMRSTSLARLPAEPDETARDAAEQPIEDATPSRPAPPQMFDRVRLARERANLTKSDLSRRVGVCLSAVVQWEQPTGTSPTVANLARIAWTTGVAFEWLATGRGPATLAAARQAEKAASAGGASPFEQHLLHVVRKLPADRHEKLIAFARALLSS